MCHSVHIPWRSALAEIYKGSAAPQDCQVFVKDYLELVICFLVQIDMSSSSAKSPDDQTELELRQLLLFPFPHFYGALP